MKFGYTILYVNSVPETVAFYEQAFGLKLGMITDTQEYAEMITGETKIAFSSNDFVKKLTHIPFEAAAPHKAAPPVELGFVTNTVEADFAHAIAAGAVVVKQPEQKPWGQLVGYVRDNNGFLVEIGAPVHP